MQKNRILVVDKDYNGLLSLREALSKAGYHIMTALDIETAEKLMRVTEFDYIILGLNQLEKISKKDIDSAKFPKHKKSELK